ncbi:hypothetical protein ZIOFF_039573 [Zingiber officinale]|uniref:Uncharacterized protein n=1 Tax=Zingiber officinale TaxID=94328 RepID=A0A8J5L388_ZINOF|nr:hypothetical protein ZIOFF_039573 [Zingiber officinale]
MIAIRTPRVRRPATPSCSGGLSGPSSPPAYLPFLMQDKAAAEDGEKETFSKKPRYCETEMPLTDSEEDSFLFPVKEIVQYPLPGYVAPSSISFSPDGCLISYLFIPDGTLHRKVFAFEVASRRQELVICPPDGGGLDESNPSAEEKLRRERSRGEGIGSHEVRVEIEVDVLFLLHSREAHYHGAIAKWAILRAFLRMRASFGASFLWLVTLVYFNQFSSILFLCERHERRPEVIAVFITVSSFCCSFSMEYQTNLWVSVSLAKTGNLKDHRDALVELVASSEYGILHLFSHHQLQFTNLKYSRVEIDEVRFEWAECMLDYI